jgi:type II secretory pathway pseudopilin PulG
MRMASINSTTTLPTTIRRRSNMARYNLSRRGRGAYTMMELLIVITIMIMLAAITLPVAKQVLNDSHLREASRQLNAYFAMAKARAIHTGRSCGIEFVCQAPLGDTFGIRAATEFYLAEVPPPYPGVTLTSRGRIMDSITQPGMNIYEFYPIIFDSMTSTYVPDVNNEQQYLLALIADGDTFLVRFDYKGPSYVCKRSGQRFIYQNFTTSGLNLPEPPGKLQSNLPGFPYQIYRSPRRIGNPLELPAGSCVDMEYSGLGQTGTQFSALSLSTLTPPPPLTGSIQLQSILILFSPQGTVESYYQKMTVGGSPWIQGPLAPTGTLHFLVGKIEKMNLPNGATDDTVRNPSNVHLFDRTESNLADPTSLWVSVGRSGGGVTTAENDPPPIGYAGSPPTSVVAFPAEQAPPGGRYQVLCPTSPTLAQFLTAQSTYLGYSRTIANNREQMRGR